MEIQLVCTARNMPQDEPVILSDATRYDASRASGGLKEFSQVALQLQGSKLRQGFLTNANP